MPSQINDIPAHVLKASHDLTTYCRFLPVNLVLRTDGVVAAYAMLKVSRILRFESVVLDGLRLAILLQRRSSVLHPSQSTIVYAICRHSGASMDTFGFAKIDSYIDC